MDRRRILIEILIEWTEGIVKPVYKKGNREEARNYRVITLMDTGYLTIIKRHDLFVCYQKSQKLLNQSF